MADEGPGTCDNKSTWPANECYKDSAVRLSPPPLLLRYPTEKKRKQGRQTERKKTTKRKKERKKERMKERKKGKKGRNTEKQKERNTERKQGKTFK